MRYEYRGRQKKRRSRAKSELAKRHRAEFAALYRAALAATYVAVAEEVRP